MKLRHPVLLKGGRFSAVLPALLLLLALSMGLRYATLAADAVPAAVPAARQPWKWPKRMVELPFGEKVRYRETNFWVQVNLRADGDSEVVIYEGEKEFTRMWTGLGGHFAILDTEASIPVLEAWGEDTADCGVRWMLCAFAGQNHKVNYGWGYMELYTPRKEEARGTEVQRVSRRPGKAETEYWFLDWHTNRTPELADEVLKKTQEIKR